MRDANGVLSCLKRALKIANAAQQQLAVAAKRPAGDAGPALLFVEILNHYLYYYDQGCELVTQAVLQVGRAVQWGKQKGPSSSGQQVPPGCSPAAGMNVCHCAPARMPLALSARCSNPSRT